MKLHAINKQKPTKKFVGRERKAMIKKRKKHNPESIRQVRNDLATGKNILHGRGEEAGLLGLV
jgi:hypothetical protein